MVTYTAALRGKPKDTNSEVSIVEHEVDIFHAEQLTEAFLTEINPEGQVRKDSLQSSLKSAIQLVLLIHHIVIQVPVLVSAGALDAPMPDSLKITFYLASKFPDLMPDAHAVQIRQFLTDLHALNYFSLSFSGRAGAAQIVQNPVLERLEKPGISDRYRKALEFKLDM
jgi:hypothetical protein